MDCLSELTLELELFLGAITPGKTLLNTRDERFQGMVLHIPSDGGLVFSGGDGVTTFSLSCDPGLVEPDTEHHVTIVLDEQENNHAGSWRESGSLPQVPINW